MPFALKNIFYTPQRLKAEQHVKRGFGTHSNLVKEVTYDEDKDDKTPCLLVIFWSSRALSLFGELEQAKHNIEKDFWGGLEHFRIDSSYPVGAWLDDSEKTHPPRQILLRSSAGDSEEEAPRVVQSRRSSRISSSSTLPEPEPRRDVKPSLSADVRAERRKGRIFLNSDPSRSLYEFPDPEVWSNEGDDESDDDDQFWDDAGFEDSDFDDAGFEEAVFESTDRQYPTDSSIPEITVSSPSDEESETKRRMSSKDMLKPDDVYKVLWKQQTKETRFLNETQRFLLPLAWLVAEAEGIDVNDLPALEMSLKSIIADRQKLIDLFPLAKILAKDQKVDVTDFKSFPRMLKNVIADRDNAKRLAEYHRVARRKLESRVAQLEMERNGESPDDEEYIRY
ncbi:hypothetical protein GL218_09036 [Daldinia childiae]|uniref:uncharacterized protein n=1 Tax=Daldinia childiae TaxID=326645 RepID=UPI0014489302|nr:uncharacterized protein GL218_09036 [Daldinia childiae]KAF3066528.1 hypothetical protein GL218_09036 [Daldinia childiae]